jgi:hypothetical protein
MASVIILLVSILLFAAVAHLLGKELVNKRHLFNYSSDYNRTALKLERQYKILSFLVLEGMLLWAVVTSMITLLTNEPF